MRTASGRVTIRDVARAAGVSVTTVSRVLAGEDVVRERTRQQVQEAIASLNFTVNAHARALAGGTSRTVGFLVEQMVGPSFAALASGVESEASDRGHLLMMSTTHGDPAREDALVTVMREQRAAAVLLVGAVHVEEQYETRVASWADSLTAVGSRLVLCGRPALSQRPDVASVQYDNVAAGRAVTEHLLELGHERMLFVAFTNSSTSQERLQGHREALSAAGVDADPELILSGTEFNPEGGERAVADALERGLSFTAVVAVTDVVAAGVLRALRAAGRAVPEDVSVTGIDDDPQASDLAPPLTTVAIPFGEVGRVAAQLALAPEGAGNRHEVLAGELVVRASTAKPRH